MEITVNHCVLFLLKLVIMDAQLTVLLHSCSKNCCGCTEELDNTREQLVNAESKQRELMEQVKKLTSEVEDVKTAAAIQEVGKEDEIAKARRQHEEELASFQQIMEGN